MKERPIHFLISLVLFSLLYLNFSFLQKSLYLSTRFPDASINKTSIELGSPVKVNLDFLVLGSRYMAVFRSRLESNNLHSYRLPFFRDAVPNVKGSINYRIKLGSEDLISKIDFSSNILNRISKTITRSSSGDFQLGVSVIDLIPSSLDDFIELSVNTEVGQLSGAYLEIYKVDNLGDILLFYPLILYYGCFVIGLLACGFLALAIFSIPQKHSFYSFLFCLLFGLFGLDEFVKGHRNRFFVKLFTFGGLGIIYAFDLGKEFYGLVLGKS